MLDIKFIRQNSEKVKEACKNKHVNADVDRVLALDEKRRQMINEVESMRAEQKKMGREEAVKASELKKRIKELEPELENVENEFKSLMYRIPNIPLEDVPVGASDAENVSLRKWGEPTKFNFAPKSYLDLTEPRDLIDTKRAAKVAGTRFGYIKGDLALLEFALINFTFKTLIKEGFVPVVPPVMIKPEMAMGMGFLEQTDDKEAYFLKDDDLCLTATSEQSIGTMHSGETFEGKDLPKRYLGFSTCFRREAGAYGKDTKGILRVHQFDKLEMFSFCRPEDSLKEHELLLKMEEKLMQALKLPYQVVRICTGDLGMPAAKKYDIEVWLPSENRYRETHSTSNCTDFQARRLGIRYRDNEGKVDFVHTLNGTAFAIGRILIAIIENFQQKDGSIKVPKALQESFKQKVIK